MGLNRMMQKQLDITRTDLHTLMTKPTMPRYIIRPVFYGNWQDEDGTSAFSRPSQTCLMTIFPGQLSLVYSLQKTLEGIFLHTFLF